MYECFFFKQKTAYEMRISDWSSDVCSSDLAADDRIDRTARPYRGDYYDHQIRSQEAFAGLLSALRESDGWTLFTMIGAHLAEAGVDLSGRTYGMDTRARVRETSMAGYADQREQAIRSSLPPIVAE